MREREPSTTSIRVRLAIHAVAVLALMGMMCPAHAARESKPVLSPTTELVWPLPPDPPRIRFVETLQGSGDLKKPSRWKRIREVPRSTPTSGS